MVKPPKGGGDWVKYRDTWSAKLGIDKLPRVHPILHIDTTTEAQRKKGWSSSKPAPWDLIRTNMDYLGSEIEKAKQLNKQRYADVTGYKKHFQIIKEPNKRYSLYSFPNQDSSYFYQGGLIAEKSKEDIDYAGTTFRSRPDWREAKRHQHDLFQDKSKTVAVVTAGLNPRDNWICNDYWCGRKPERDARDLGLVVPFKNSVIVPVPTTQPGYRGQVYGDLYRTRAQSGKFEERGAPGKGRGVIMGFRGKPEFPETKVKVGLSGIVEQSKPRGRIVVKGKNLAGSEWQQKQELEGRFGSTMDRETASRNYETIGLYTPISGSGKFEKRPSARVGAIIQHRPDEDELAEIFGLGAVRVEDKRRWNAAFREEGSLKDWRRPAPYIGYGYVAEAEVGKGSKGKKLYGKGEAWWEAQARLKPQVEYFEGKSEKYVEDDVKYPTFKLPVKKIDLSRMSPYPEKETRERDWEQLGDLSSAIRRGDRLPPLQVRKGEKGTDAEGKYVLVDGYHRYLAYKSAGVKDIPVYDEATGERIRDEDLLVDEMDLNIKGEKGSPLYPEDVPLSKYTRFSGLGLTPERTSKKAEAESKEYAGTEEQIEEEAEAIAKKE